MKIAPLLATDVVEIARHDPESLREGLAPLHVADLAELLGEIEREDRVRVMEHLAPTRLPIPVLSPALDALEPDDAAALLSFLPEERRGPFLAAMSAGHALA